MDVPILYACVCSAAEAQTVDKMIDFIVNWCPKIACAELQNQARSTVHLIAAPQRAIGRPHKSMFFRPLFGPPKGPRALPGPRCGVGAPNIGSEVKNIKVAGRNNMQNAAVVAPNGAICCK